MATSQTSTGFKGIHQNDNSSSETERCTVDASGWLHQAGTKITSTAAELNLIDGVSYAPAMIGNAASPSYTGYRYKFVTKTATMRTASKAFLFSDLKQVIYGNAVTQVSGASIAARKPGAGLSYAAYYTAASQTGAGATLRLFPIMNNGVAASAAAAYRVRILALGTV